MIHVYFGEGKGKTTAGLGLVLRAAGQGYSPAVFSFLKNEKTGEANMLCKIEEICVFCCQTKVQGFFWDMSPREKQLLQMETVQGFFKAQMCAKSGKHGMLLLDEIGGCLENGLISEKDLLAFLQTFGSSMELVLTGRKFPASILEIADYVSEIRAIKHPYEKGVSPRRGIEY